MTGSKKTGEPLFDDTLQLIKESNKVRNCQHWVSKIPSGVKDLRKRILDQLIDKRILKEEERRILWLFPANRYPTKDARPERELRERIRNAVLKKKEPDSRTAIIIILMKACGLIPEVFDKHERKEAKKRIQEITEANPVGKGIEESVAAIQAAVCAAVLMMTTTNIAINT